jgi:hypothetical protein
MPFTQMTALGISLIGFGLALVCIGLAFWPRAPRSEPAVFDGPDEFRIILDALDEEDRREERWDLAEPPANEQLTDPAGEAAIQLGKQRRRLG